MYFLTIVALSIAALTIMIITTLYIFLDFTILNTFEKYER